MAKGRDKQGRETKKKTKAKQPQAPSGPAVDFRHHSVVTGQQQPPAQPRATE